MNNNNFRLFALFLLIILIWGLAWPVAKLGLVYMSPLWYTASRLIIGTVTMLAIVALMGKLSWPKAADLPLILVIGILQISLYLWLTNIGLAYLPAGRSSLIAYTTPLWIMPIATFFFKERSSLFRWLGFLLGILGLLILLSPWEISWNKNVFFGCSMLLLASLSWAISMLCARYMHWSKSPFELIPWQLLIATLPVLIYALTQEPATHIDWGAPLLWSLAYTGILVTGFSYWGGLIINKEMPTIVVSIGFLTVPVLSLIISAIFMHEAISVTTITAMGMILLGLACVVV